MCTLCVCVCVYFSACVRVYFSMCVMDKLKISLIYFFMFFVFFLHGDLGGGLPKLQPSPVEHGGTAEEIVLKSMDPYTHRLCFCRSIPWIITPEDYVTPSPHWASHVLFFQVAPASHSSERIPSPLRSPGASHSSSRSSLFSPCSSLRYLGLAWLSP